MSNLWPDGQSTLGLNLPKYMHMKEHICPEPGLMCMLVPLCSTWNMIANSAPKCQKEPVQSCVSAILVSKGKQDAAL